MNSHRDNVKDAIMFCLENEQGVDLTKNQIDELKYNLADAVFDALGITEDEQDKYGGYFMIHAEERLKCVGCGELMNSAERNWEGKCDICHNQDLANGREEEWL